MRFALLVALACGSQPVAPRPVPDAPRCLDSDGRAGPMAVQGCAASGYRASRPRHLVPEMQPERSPGCDDDGECRFPSDRTACNSMVCRSSRSLPPPPPSEPGAPTIDVGSQIGCTLTDDASPKYRGWLCGCVQHACAWFTQ